jgi:hypothetical protein
MRHHRIEAGELAAVLEAARGTGLRRRGEKHEG